MKTSDETTETQNSPAVQDSWVLDVLEPDQLVGAKKEHYPRARLGGGIRILMWAMRAYVIFMLVVVGYQVWVTIHAS